MVRGRIETEQQYAARICQTVANLLRSESKHPAPYELDEFNVFSTGEQRRRPALPQLSAAELGQLLQDGQHWRD